MSKTVKVGKNTKATVGKNKSSVSTKNKSGKMSIDSKGNVDLELNTPIDGLSYKKKKNIILIVKKLFKL